MKFDVMRLRKERVIMDKYDIIENAERQFAREVTLGVIVTHPLTAWHYIIPGFFIIDFLRRGSAIRQYTKHFMFSRKLAMDTAVKKMQAERLIFWIINMKNPELNSFPKQKNLLKKRIWF